MFEIASRSKGAPTSVVVRREVVPVVDPGADRVMEAEIRASQGAFLVDLCELEFLDLRGSAR